ncbi:MAG: shikimate kinase [Phycisphaerales bacterium]|nr:shikimate kinase [Phycisphaerales bacterium]
MDAKSQNIYLIGMPGVGKSYWAEQIAVRYALQCVDLDSILEVRTNMRIATFFERYGAAEFRKLERLTLMQVLEVFNCNTVVACGGGTPCFYDNLAQMKTRGNVVYLQSSLSYLFQNLSDGFQDRPLLRLPDWQEKLSEILDQRRPIFEQADYTLNVASLSVQDFEPIVSAIQ